MFSIIGRVAARVRGGVRHASIIDPGSVDSTIDDDCPIAPRRSGAAPAWPDDPDEVPDWIIAFETHRAAVGIVPARVPTRTRREYEAAIERIAAKVEHEDARIQHPALPPADAAAEFLGALRASERTGQYTSDELAAAYIGHCTATARRPCAEHLLRSELAKLDGVRSVQICKRIGGKRHRPTMWYIAPAPAADDGASPEIELSYEHEDRRIAA